MVNEYKWQASPTPGGACYAKTTQAGKCFGMHRLILGIVDRPDLIVDHVNRDPLDNRRENLRLCTRADNARNHSHRRGKSGFIGVEKITRSTKWRAHIAVNYKLIRWGAFETPEAAARARDDKARELHGEYAVLNFPEDV